MGELFGFKVYAYAMGGGGGGGWEMLDYSQIVFSVRLSRQFLNHRGSMWPHPEQLVGSRQHLLQTQDSDQLDWTWISFSGNLMITEKSLKFHSPPTQGVLSCNSICDSWKDTLAAAGTQKLFRVKYGVSDKVHAGMNGTIGGPKDGVSHIHPSMQYVMSTYIPTK